MIASILPGRIRARVARGTPGETLDALRKAVNKAASGATLDYCERSGGLLVTWNPGPKRDAAVLAAVRQAVGPEPQGRQPLNWPAMRTVKRGMAASLGVALAALALRSERTHIWAGGVFTAFLARHLYVYRKRILK